MAVATATVIVPVGMDPIAEERRIRLAMRYTAGVVRTDMAATTQTWLPENQPAWEERLYYEGRDLVYEYITGSEPFVYVDSGTEPHPITAGPGKTLTFQRGWMPKTLPGMLGAGPGARWGEWVRKREVQHPGSAPRNFSKRVVEHAVKVLIHLLSRIASAGAGAGVP